MCRVNSYKANYRHRTVDTSNYIMDQYNIKSKTNYRQGLERKNALMQKSKQTK
jgi:hypothetical protein